MLLKVILVSAPNCTLVELKLEKLFLGRKKKKHSKLYLSGIEMSFLSNLITFLNPPNCTLVELKFRTL